MYIDLKPLVEKIESSIATVGQVPTLAIVHYGEREDSTDFIKSIERKAKRPLVNPIVVDLEDENIESTVTGIINIFDGILPVRPFSDIAEEIIKTNLNTFKDIDNFTGRSTFNNCTGEAVLEILKYLQIGTEEKICIVGRLLD